MRLLLALILLWASAWTAVARPVLVTSGEHRDFTRIVLQFDGKPDWIFGRTLDGYALRIPGQAPDYDLGRAFDLIGKTRLAALAPDPQTGDLQLGLACACHAMPFEFRPGIVVIDLYDGAPPAGSSFEEPMPPLSGAPVAEPVQAQAAEPSLPPSPTPDAEALVGGYDWTRLSLQQMGLDPGDSPQQAQNAPAVPVPEALDPNLDKLRASLVAEMGRGATAGLIDIALPKETKPAEAAPEPSAAADPAPAAAEGPAAPEPDPAMIAHLGETPEITLRDSGESGPPLTASGAKCLPDEALDVGSWGAAERPIDEQFGPIRQGMVGEFDRPSPEAIKRVIRFYLFIGFGAEARSLLRAYPDLFEDAPIWTAMAHLVDGEADPTGTFTGMEDCDTAAALWAVLSDPSALPRDEIGRAAVARNFSSLPVALRRLLGPRLVKAYLDGGDIPTATTLSEAVLRAPGDPGPEVAMMEADMARALGHNSAAEAKLEPIASSPGPGATDALVDLVTHRAMLGQSVTEEQVASLEAALEERSGSPDEARYRSALVLAKAASGDFDAAFTEAGSPEALRQIWKILAQSGGDTPLLTHAVLAEGQTPPPEAEASAGLIADRLLMLGLADQAQRWVVLAPAAPPLLRARIALANGDASGALDLLKDDSSEQALHLKAEALSSLGDQEGAAKVYQELGKPDQQWSALSNTQDWQQISEAGPDAWKAVAGVVTGAEPAAPAPATGGQLAEGKRLVDDSVSTRDAITNLLNSVQVPTLPSQ